MQLCSFIYILCMAKCVLPQQSWIVRSETLCPAKSKIFTLWTFTKKFPPYTLKLGFNGKLASINPLVFCGHLCWSKKKNVILDISQTEGSEVPIKLSKAMIYVEKFSFLNPTLLCTVSLHIFKKRFNVNFIFISMRICHLLVVVFSAILSIPAIAFTQVIYVYVKEKMCL